MNRLRGLFRTVLRLRNWILAVLKIWMIKLLSSIKHSNKISMRNISIPQNTPLEKTARKQVNPIFIWYNNNTNKKQNYNYSSNQEEIYKHEERHLLTFEHCIVRVVIMFLILYLRLYIALIDWLKWWITMDRIWVSLEILSNSSLLIDHNT